MHASGCDVLVLDPADGSAGPPARVYRETKGRCEEWAFHGSYHVERAPLAWFESFYRMLARASDDALIVVPGYRSSPLLRDIFLRAAQVAKPEEILVDAKLDLGLSCWPVGPSIIELALTYPEIVIQAQRKAQWLKLFEASTEQQIDLRACCIQGARLGSGVQFSHEERLRFGMEDAQYAELCGNVLLVITRSSYGSERVGKLLDVTHAIRAVVLHPEAYSNLLCSLARQNGEDFAMGLLTGIDFEAMTASVLTNAVPPAPAKILKIGHLRLDRRAVEGEVVAPWSI
jgi:hypothetical protein